MGPEAAARAKLVRFLAVLVAVVGIMLLQNSACAAGLPPAECCPTGAATSIVDAHPDEPQGGLRTEEAPSDRGGAIGACLMLLVAALLAVLGLRRPLGLLCAAVRLQVVSLPRVHLPAPRLAQLCILRT
jgi:hypothetical protein